MKTFRFSASLALAGALAGTAGAALAPTQATQPPTLAAGERVQPFDAPSPSGATRQVNYPKGTVTVLLFFSSWCTTCAERQDALSELARGLRDRVVFVGVVTEDEPAELDSYLRTHRAEFPVVVDTDGTISRSYAVREPGAVVLVAKGGALLRGWPGGLDASTLDTRIRELLLG